MRPETAGNATVRGPPQGRWARVTRGGDVLPQFTIIHHPSLTAAVAGRSGTFPGRPVFVAADPAQPANHNRNNNRRKLDMKVVRTNDNRPMTPREIQVCQQFEQSDRSGQALWWPLTTPGNPVPGDPASDCLVLLEGNGRYALTFLHDRWSVREGEWRRHAEDGAVTPMGDVREDAWEAAMSIKDRLSQDLDFGCYVIPVMVITDMTPDPDILEEMRGSKVRLLWGLDDLVARLADLPEGDQVQKQLGKRFISREVGTLSRRPAAARPTQPPQAATVTVSGEPVTVRDGDDVHIDIHLHFTITAPGDGDDPSLNVRVR